MVCILRMFLVDFDGIVMDIMNEIMNEIMGYLDGIFGDI